MRSGSIVNALGKALVDVVGAAAVSAISVTYAADTLAGVEINVLPKVFFVINIVFVSGTELSDVDV